MLSELQQKILNNPAHNMFVESAAASGKTALLIEKTKQLMNDHQGPVVAFTFTNAAAEEMSKRLGDYDKDNVFVGTIHAYCLRLLLSHGITKALEYIEEQLFDQLFSLLKENLECVSPVYAILCDEMQDCNEEQFEFIFDILEAKKRFCCYDKRQSIYRWRDAHPEYIDKYIFSNNSKNGFDYSIKGNTKETDWEVRYIDNYISQTDGTVVYMNENYRNGYEILSFAKSIIRQAGAEYTDYSVAMRPNSGRVINVNYSPSAIASTIKRLGDYKNWFILTRTNDQSDEIMNYLEKEEVPASSFKRSQLTNAELYEKLQSDDVKVLTIHTAKGLEAKNVVVIGARFYNLEEKCISYVAATRARDLLVWATIPTKSKRQMMANNWER